MSVPYCHACDFHRWHVGNGYHGLTNGKERHWCKEPSVVFSGMNKLIYAKETKTSPKWCPRR